MRWTFESPFDPGLDLDEGVQVMNWLAEDGIDYGHVSHLDLAARSVKYPGEIALTRIRAGVDRALPLMCAGGVTSAADAARANHAMAREVGLPLQRALLAFGRGACDDAADALYPVRAQAQRFGGSHAQRDLVDLTLLAAAAGGSRRALGQALLRERSEGPSEPVALRSRAEALQALLPPVAKS